MPEQTVQSPLKPCETSLDLLLVSPSLMWQEEQKKKLSMRIDKDIPNQETPHIGVAYLLAMAQQNGIHARYIDMVSDGVSPEDLAQYVANVRPTVIGFSAFTVLMNAAGELAALVKAASPESLICAGGPHVSALPHQTLEEFPSLDFVVCGEGELVVVEFFKRLRAGLPFDTIPGLVTRGNRDVSWSPVNDIDSIPYPAWDRFNLDKYQGTYPHRTKLELPMVTGRGCPFKCVFCCRALGNVVRRRSVASVIAEIEHNIDKYGCESIAFLDETFVLNKTWFNEFCSEMIKRGLNKKITWSCSTRVSNTSLELFKQMKESGCYYIFFGMESADDTMLKRINKGITVDEIRSAVQWAKESGIIPVGAFIIGLPGDVSENTQKAIELGHELDLYSITFPIAVPFVGTELREMAVRGEYGMRILSQNWDHYGKQDPGVMDSEDLSWAERKELQKLAYSHFPKQNLDAYLDRQRSLGYPF